MKNCAFIDDLLLVYKCLILGTSLSDTNIYLSKDMRIHVYFFDVKRGL
jgi:hypothetical protein